MQDTWPNLVRQQSITLQVVGSNPAVSSQEQLPNRSSAIAGREKSSLVEEKGVTPASAWPAGNVLSVGGTHKQEETPVAAPVKGHLAQSG